MEQHKTAPSLRFIRAREAIKKTGLSKSSIYDLMAQGQFPKAIRLCVTGRAVGWIESEIDAWMASRIAESRGEAA